MLTTHLWGGQSCQAILPAAGFSAVEQILKSAQIM
jgi:hypothetical protein